MDCWSLFQKETPNDMRYMGCHNAPPYQDVPLVLYPSYDLCTVRDMFQIGTSCILNKETHTQ